MVKNPPADAGDTGLIPDPGRPTCRRAAKPVGYIRGACALEPGGSEPWSPSSATREATAKRSLCAATKERSPLTATKENAHTAQPTRDDLARPKIIKFLKKNT